MAAVDAEPGAVLSAEQGRHVIVQFAALPGPDTRAHLQVAGVRLLQYLGDNAYFARLTGDDRSIAAARNAGMTAASAIDPAWKLHPMLLRGDYPAYSVFEAPAVRDRLGDDAAEATDANAETTLAIYLILHGDVEADSEGLDAVGRHGGTVRSHMRSINGVVAWIPLSNLAALASEDAVQWIEPPLPPLDVVNDSNRVVTQVDQVQALPYDLDGTGVTVLVYDGGAALASHADFGGRLTVRDATAVHYHPTHVAGTIGGDGSVSGGTYRGMAPAVTMQSYGFQYDGSGTFLYTNPGDLESDYDEAVNVYGAEISNNSIGTNTAANGFPCSYEGDYGATSMLIDAIVRGSLGAPMRIVWANGNERGNGRCGTDYLTTAPPACAKNHITV
ncbi:MAG: S8 family serine peptidase, partial [Planctomycetota bacterium]